MSTKKIVASIITIGDELLIGQTIDTNSAWMAQELNKVGIWVHRRLAVGDTWDAIWNALDAESMHSDIILITGGLGPTADDITKPLLCEYFQGKMITDAGALENVIDIFQKKLNRPLLERNLKQAEVPDVCTVIQNKRGTAPGMWFEKDTPSKKIFVSMPGVPHEMKGMMLDNVIPSLQERFQIAPIAHRTLLTAGLGESFLAERIQDFEKALPDFIKLAYLPNYGMVKLRLTLAETQISKLEILEQKFKQLQEELADIIVINEDIPLHEVVGQQLKKINKTLGTAESCTGGYIAHLLTSPSGASQYFKGAIISYDNEVKENILAVPSETLLKEGAVSEATAASMLRGAFSQLKTDYALAVTGIMGPTGGTETKPVGTVWVAVGNAQKMETRCFQFRFDRKRNIELTANSALNMVRQFIAADSSASI